MACRARKYAIPYSRYRILEAEGPLRRGGRGLPAKEVQSLLGHNTISMTLDIYGHLFPNQAGRDELSNAVKSLLA